LRAPDDVGKTSWGASASRAGSADFPGAGRGVLSVIGGLVVRAGKRLPLASRRRRWCIRLENQSRKALRHGYRTSFQRSERGSVMPLSSSQGAAVLGFVSYSRGRSCRNSGETPAFDPGIVIGRFAVGGLVSTLLHGVFALSAGLGRSTALMIRGALVVACKTCRNRVGPGGKSGRFSRLFMGLGFLQ